MNSLDINSPIGILNICEEKGNIVNLYLKTVETNTEQSKFHQHSDLLYEAYKQLNEYFAGNRQSFHLPLKSNGTVFQKEVWNELQKISYGETRCYEDIAIGIGNKKAVRAIGQANNKNPIMIIIPCHRVINKNGSIGGFGCGVNAKKYLLDLEGSLS
ncbi:MAG: methylated-DNA--[protein]-cysteine S-methyltransferase [Lachnospiraceae bacterium]|nr:methylated-DNA--[protein]-cysteine S-methyltransferase [Lachnospiraceae bacterium]